MVVDSTGNAYVAWGTTGASGWVKYLIQAAHYDWTAMTEYADTTGETYGYASKPGVVVLPDDSFFMVPTR